mgnify:CR=1 FL=1
MNLRGYVSLGALIAFIIFSTNVSAAGLLDGILQTYQGATAGWMKVAQGYAFMIFSGLAPLAISFWSIQSLVFEGLDVSALIGKLMTKIFWMAFFFTVIYLAPTWVPQVTDTFMVMGKGFAGSSGTVVTSPSQMMDIGVKVAHGVFSIWNVAASGNIASFGNNVLLALTLWASALCALAAFAIVALQLLLTQVELAIMAPIGVVVLGFFATPATKAIAEKYPSYLISVGVKLMFIFAMASLAPKIGDVAMASVADAAATGAVPLAEVFGLAVSLVIYGILCLQIPAMASGMLSGSVSTSLGGIAGAAMAAGGAVAGAAMAAGGAVAGTAMGGKAAIARLAELTGATNGSAGDAFSGIASGLGSMFPGGSASSASPVGGDPFKNVTPSISSGVDSIGGTPNTPSQPKGQSTFSSGMDKLNQGIGGLAASEGQTGAGVDINSGNHGG